MHLGESVVVLGLQEHHSIVGDLVDQPIRLVDPTRRDVPAEVVEVLRLADGMVGVTQGGLAIGGHPIAQVVEAPLR